MKKNSVIKVIIFFTVITFTPFIIDIFTRAGAIILGEQTLTQSPYLYTVCAYLPILTLLFIYINALLEPKENFGLVIEKKLVPASIIIGLISGVTIYLIDVKTGLITDFGVPNNPSITLALGFIISWGLLAPFVEELLFRGIIQSELMRSISSKLVIHPAVFIASAFEVLMHLGYPLYFAQAGTESTVALSTTPQLIYVAIFGMIGGVIYQKTKSLAGPLIIHAMGNIIELILFWILN